MQQSHPGPAAPLPSRHSHHHHLPASAPASGLSHANGHSHAGGQSPAEAPAINVTNTCCCGIALTPANVLLKAWRHELKRCLLDACSELSYQTPTGATVAYPGRQASPWICACKGSKHHWMLKGRKHSAHGLRVRSMVLHHWGDFRSWATVMQIKAGGLH